MSFKEKVKDIVTEVKKPKKITDEQALAMAASPRAEIRKQAPEWARKLTQRPKPQRPKPQSQSVTDNTHPYYKKVKALLEDDDKGEKITLDHPDKDPIRGKSQVIVVKGSNDHAIATNRGFGLTAKQWAAKKAEQKSQSTNENSNHPFYQKVKELARGKKNNSLLEKKSKKIRFLLLRGEEKSKTDEALGDLQDGGPRIDYSLEGFKKRLAAQRAARVLRGEAPKTPPGPTASPVKPIAKKPEPALESKGDAGAKDLSNREELRKQIEAELEYWEKQQKRPKKKQAPSEKGKRKKPKAEEPGSPGHAARHDRDDDDDDEPNYLGLRLGF